MKKMPIAIFPGTFDPITNGHLELITRASRMFPLLIIGVAASPNKKAIFSLDERTELATKTLAHLDNVQVIGFSELMANFARKNQATVLVRGVRTTYDFEYEKQLAELNQHLKADLDTVFLMPSPNTSFISSSIVKEVALHHGDIRQLVPDLVREALLSKINLDKDVTK